MREGVREGVRSMRVLMMLMQEDTVRSVECEVWPGSLTPGSAGEEDRPDWSSPQRNLRGRVSLHPHPASRETGGAGPGAGLEAGAGPGEGGGVLWGGLECPPGGHKLLILHGEKQRQISWSLQFLKV